MALRCKLKMTFASKVLAALLSVVVVSSLAITMLAYFALRLGKENDHVRRYTSLGTMIAHAFQRMEYLTDSVGRNAVKTLMEIEKTRGLLSNKELTQLAQSLGISGFYIINRYGTFIRSSDLPIELQVNSLFDCCDEYQQLLDHNPSLQTTPMIPSFPYGMPQKFTIAPNKNRTLIFEASMNLKYIGDILYEVLQDNASISTLGVYAPSGYALATVPSIDHHNHRRLQPPEMVPGKKIQGDRGIFTFRIPASADTCCECCSKGIDLHGDPYYYLLRMDVSLHPLTKETRALRNWAMGAFVGVMFFSVILAKWLAGRLVAGIERIHTTAQAIVESGNLDLRVNIPGDADEISNLAQTFDKMIEGWESSQVHLIETEKMRTIAKLASQVAHDIRSPLAALEVASTYLTELPDAQRNLIRNAIHRIRDIANNLLSRYKGGTFNLPYPKTLANSSEPMYTMLDSIVSEKRAQYATRHIVFSLGMASEACNAFAKVDSIAFKRMLSNLLDNAAESIDDHGEVHVYMEKNPNICITIEDNGCGIAPEFLPAILKGGTSIGKQEGMGLGLTNAIKGIEAWQGSVDIQSTVGHGTRITIGLPQTQPAPWFAENLVIPANTTLVILDDDEFIADIWKKRLDGLVATSICTRFNVPELLWFRRSEDLAMYLSIHLLEVGACLVDYELFDEPYSGIDVIKKLGILTLSTLVTNHYEDFNLRSTCESMGLKIIPKSFAASIPIQVNTGPRQMRRLNA